MRAVVVYDVSNDKARRRVSDLLLQYGVRVQRSAFEIYLEPWERDRLAADLEALIDKSRDRVAVYPMSQRTYRARRWLGRGPLESLPDGKPPFFIV